MGCGSCQPNESLVKHIVKMECYRMLGLQRAHRATDEETKAKRGEGCVWSQSVSGGRAGLPVVPQDSAPSTYHGPTLTPAPSVLSRDKNRIRVSSPKNYLDVTGVSKHIWNGTSEDSKHCSQEDMHRADHGGHMECSQKPLACGKLLEGGGLVLKPSSTAQVLCDFGRVAYSL